MGEQSLSEILFREALHFNKGMVFVEFIQIIFTSGLEKFFDTFDK
jgi:hypothetical protein